MTRMLRSRLSTLAHSGKSRGIVALLLPLLLLSAVTLGLAPAQARSRAVTFNVDSTLDEPDATPGDGSCASTPSGLCTLRAAVQEANALAGTDTIALPAGSYTLTLPGRGEDLSATGDLDLQESVTIQGGDSGDGLGTSGGGIAVASGSQLTLEDVTLSGNSSGDSGGGIYNNGGELALRRVQVVANNAATAAGIRNSGSLSIQDSTVADNRATQTGGGILNTGSLILERVTISGNIADTNGGGLYLHSADPATGLVSIQNSTISGNQAKAWMGGGIWVYYQTELWLTDSTLANNRAGQGGGIFNYHQQATLAPARRSRPDNVAQAGNIHLRNTIVANNTFVNCGRSLQTEPIHSLGHNLDSGTTCEFAQATDLRDTNPQLLSLWDNGGPSATHALLATSPAIDAGDDTACPLTDQRGVTRPQGRHCDIGAFEYVPGADADLSLAKQASPDPVLAGSTLTYTLSANNHGPGTAISVAVTDSLPPAVTFLSALGSGWSCSQNADMVTCGRSSLAQGVAPDIVIRTIAPHSSGVITNTATVASVTADPDPTNNSDSVRSTVKPVYRVYLPLVTRP